MKYKSSVENVNGQFAQKRLKVNRQKFTGPSPQLKVEEQHIECAGECACLGILVDKKLDWKPQAKNVSKAFGVKVKKIRTMSYLRKKFLEQIYFKTIIPAVLYTKLVLNFASHCFTLLSC